MLLLIEKENFVLIRLSLAGFGPGNHNLGRPETGLIVSQRSRRLFVWCIRELRMMSVPASNYIYRQIITFLVKFAG